MAHFLHNKKRFGNIPISLPSSCSSLNGFPVCLAAENKTLSVIPGDSLPHNPAPLHNMLHVHENVTLTYPQVYQAPTACQALTPATGRAQPGCLENKGSGPEACGHWPHQPVHSLPSPLPGALRPPPPIPSHRLRQPCWPPSFRAHGRYAPPGQSFALAVPSFPLFSQISARVTLSSSSHQHYLHEAFRHPVV